MEDKQDKQPIRRGDRRFSPRAQEVKDEFDSRLLDLARVVRVVKGGRRFRFRATVVVGNKIGKVGIGVAKGRDVSLAVEKATRQAKKNISEVLIKQGSISYEVSAKYKAAKVLLKPAKEGKGIVAGGAVRVVCELVGIQNIVGKILGRTTSKLNNAVATIKALEQLQLK